MSAALAAVPDTPGDPAPAEPRPSFFADRLAGTHRPYELPSGRLIDPPDDRQVAELDDAESALDDLEILVGDAVDEVLHELDDHGLLPGDAAEDLLVHFHLDLTPDGGWYELVERLNVYGRDIEYDLWERGYRLTDYFLGEVPGGWDHLLLTVLPRLPQGSSFWAALVDDDELAAQIAAQHGPPSKRPKGSGRPPLRGWTREVAYQHSIDNRLGYLAWAVFAAQAGKKRGNPPRPRKGPETADDRYEHMDFMREHDEVVSQVLKRKGGTKKHLHALPGMPKAEAVRGAVLLNPQLPQPAAVADGDPDPADG